MQVPIWGRDLDCSTMKECSGENDLFPELSKQGMKERVYIQKER